MQQQHENRPIVDFAFYELLCYKFERRRLNDLVVDNDKIPLLIERLKSISGWTNVVLKLLYTSARVVDDIAQENTDFSVEFHSWMLDFLLKMYVEESGEDFVNTDGVSVLHVACTRPKVEFVKRLLEEKPDVNRQVPHRSNSKFAGYTPLHFAVYHGNHEVAELLLKRGARIYEYDLNGSTPLHVACYRRDSKMINFILTHYRVPANVVDSNGLSHFMVACSSNEPAFAKEYLRVAECQLLTSTETLLNSRTKNIVDGQFAGYTPLHFAAEYGSAKVFELLLARGARCCAISTQLFTPLMLAHKHGHEQIVPLVFECRCDRDETHHQVDVDDVVGEGDEDVEVVFEKIVRDENADESAFVGVDGEESGYVSKKGIVNVVTKISVIVNGNDKEGKIVKTAKSPKSRLARDSYTVDLEVSSRKRTRKAVCCLACCNPRIARSKRFRKI